MGRRERIEPWDVWYPKARAAYQQVTSETSDDKIIELFKDVTPIPHCPTYAVSEIGQLRSDDLHCEKRFVAESVRLFKEEFGDSDSYLAIISDGVPVFFLGWGNLDANCVHTIICSVTKSYFGKTITFRRTSVLITADRRSLLGRWTPTHTIVDYLVAAFLLVVCLIFWAFSIPFFIWVTIRNYLVNKKHPGWGWGLIWSNKSLPKARQDFDDPGQQFVDGTNQMTGSIFATAFNNIQTARGSQVSVSQRTAQGMPKTED